MAKYSIKLKKSCFPNDADIKRLMAYIEGKGSNKDTEKAYIGAYGTKKNHKKAAEQMIKVQKYFSKNNARRVYHLIVSFKEIDSLDAVMRAAEAIAEEIFKERQVFYGIHTSKEHLHIHFAFNAVSYRDGRKWHKNKDEFKIFRSDLLSLIESAVYENYESML